MSSGRDLKYVLTHWYKQPGQDVYITNHGLMCYRREGDVLWTGTCWVHPDHRRQGVMTRIVKALACLPGVNVLKSRTNPRNKGATIAYQKMGRRQPRLVDGAYLWEDDVAELKQRWANDD